MTDESSQGIKRDIDSVISDLCRIILIEEESLDYKKANEYIESLEPEEIKELNEGKLSNHQVRTIVLDELLSYVSKFSYNKAEASAHPFTFDGGGAYSNYCVSFEKNYKEKNAGNSMPEAIRFTLTYIQEIIDQYRVFGMFYDIHSERTAARILDNMEARTEKKAEEAIKKGIKAATEEAADKAATAAVALAQKGAEQAKEAAEDAANKAAGAAKKAVRDAVNAEMNKVTNKISETSVTILGIFAGIVLTVVAGLFYSSSVIESMTSADTNRLILVSTLVGFVCINLMAVMFNYIDKIRTNDVTAKTKNDETENEGICKKVVFKKKICSHLFVVILDAILLVIIGVSWCSCLKSDFKINSEVENKNIAIDVNISESEIIPTPKLGEQEESSKQITLVPTLTCEAPKPSEAIVDESPNQTNIE